ncbi:cytochrome C oxidase assembly protein [Microvirga vignae]|uniref:Cytochrome c oxidase assembly protein CtaG n=1 Tax=Microvirga vignae TaxID=1225564 RepID=A0A0H1R816_9HYPH|nr:cytochrome c oxidase assembly protein [Microvirga vignae]KLK91219.1 cytochrome C oxidase assembly protein [Microvirga vignae]
MAEAPHTQRKLHRTALACAGIAVGMVGLAYASVPLYDLFCKVTGFDGTPITRVSNDSDVLDRTISVRFDANVAPGLKWRFSPEKPEITVKLGETTTVYYKVTNTGDQPATGIATYNVQPDLAGTYFSKLECFCFTEQTLQPGESLESAVVFYVDPRLAQDSDVKDLSSITLSYTYFPSKAGKPVAEATSSTQQTVQ